MTRTFWFVDAWHRAWPSCLLVLSVVGASADTTKGGDSPKAPDSLSMCGREAAPLGPDEQGMVRIALEMIAKCPGIDGGGELLERAALAGSDWANLQLGWLYMEDVGARSESGRFRVNRKKSLEHLRLVRGEHLPMAKVLAAANLLEQSTEDATLRRLGEAELERAQAYLAAEDVRLNDRQMDDPKAVARRMQLYEAWRVLAGVARTFKVASLREFW